MAMLGTRANREPCCPPDRLEGKCTTETSNSGVFAQHARNHFRRIKVPSCFQPWSLTGPRALSTGASGSELTAWPGSADATWTKLVLAAPLSQPPPCTLPWPRPPSPPGGSVQMLFPEIPPPHHEAARALRTLIL